MHVHILGICGSFMGGIAALAKSLGHTVTGSDRNVYPPMSTQLEALGITLTEGYDVSQFTPEPDMVIIGNAMSRGNPAVEYVLDRNLPYTSGPQWLLDNLLKDRWVLAVAGTHGKTSTASIAAWILEYAGYTPGFLIGGVPENFGVSARIGEGNFFVIEADEYDSAFFDKRSKFVHYRPRTLVLNNLEFDHADIFDDLNAIKKQFHHLVRSVPANGLILSEKHDNNMQDVLEMGCWTRQEFISKDWTAQKTQADGGRFEVYYQGQLQGEVHWELIGDHNVHNGLMAIAAAHNVGVTTEIAIASLSEFVNVKRRMEIKGKVNNITVYDDFAHHPTAIKTTVEGLKAKVGVQRILAILEPRSNTMKLGIHKDQLTDSWAQADEVYIFEPANLSWSIDEVARDSKAPVHNYQDVEKLVAAVVKEAQPSDHILVMSNGGFAGIHGKLLDALTRKYEDQ
ncbi:MAG: UDP-N-acetylmuramate:L-alanyl-gamma-D-glutamyl-meso-diaminopimelate ligase [Glaciecola sp.]|jgi:UDP-N-acetylmuramate: L-alanyl-gamma-D-glutamyl-meso-diaminopimelate ligase|nr:UDP-N-acetylmuramate:L-alanyl-gamma-D-glutamyl-meso-diaminopimelate ligase [Glaciecola sp.]MDG1815454.1 UDP-N-acetylmuramate:L-alanyl-gamma-D-glutamyl-meso-diaminopimelate ligase [Glaciecola sp.]MDG2099853.1 UDP-N-acetylmuramate:L-alanyl-gamma-D-glutamyl-meso-diaminopimelate ligase [Glaciecola sp.]